MAKVTIAFAVALIAIGSFGYFSVGGSSNSSSVRTETSTEVDQDPAQDAPKRSVTALIPAFLGILLLICGAVALQESARKHAMHAAVMVGMVGFILGGIRITGKLSDVFTTDSNTNWTSFGFACLMTMVCATFVALCVNSFIQARKTRKEEEALAKRNSSDDAQN